MAKRDPEKTARNKIISELSIELKKLLPDVLHKTGISSEASLNGKFGGKFANYIDIKNEVIHSPDHFISLWFQGLENYLEKNASPSSRHYKNYFLIKKYKVLREYLFLFFKRTYLRNYEALSKKRPKIEDSEIYIGQNNSDYGILITLRFKNGKWENDKSEIRHFTPNYWSIGHILKTGFVIPFKNNKIIFNSVGKYLDFFKNVIVRNSGSKYEYEIASLYCDFVNRSKFPEKVPLLIPEFRYDGLEKKHLYRLDFCIIDPIELTKIGIELSPWSTHGYLYKTNKLSQKEINEKAKDNFQKEIRKHRAFFNKYGIIVLIYTDDSLKDCNKLFNNHISKYLVPKRIGQQLKFHIINKYFN